MTRQWIKAVAASAIGAALVLGAIVPAQAAPAQRAPSVSAAASTSSQAAAFRYHSRYSSRSACEARGAAGSAQGVWTAWECRRPSTRFYELWVDDNCRICFASGHDLARTALRVRR